MVPRAAGTRFGHEALKASWEVVPYAVRSILDSTGKNIEVFSEHLAGLDFYFNAGMIDSTDAKHVRNVLEDALKALSKQEDA